MAEPFVAEIRMFGFNFPPKNWAFCNGQILAIAQNTALFSLVGTMYGGNGQTTFALPNLQGNLAMDAGNGAGLSPRTQGETGGSELVTLQLTQLGSHTHGAGCTQSVGDDYGPFGDFWAADAGGFNQYAAATNTAMSPGALSTNGGSGAHNNLQPFLALNFCIALFGVFPSRN